MPRSESLHDPARIVERGLDPEINILHKFQRSIRRISKTICQHVADITFRKTAKQSFEFGRNHQLFFLSGSLIGEMSCSFFSNRQRLLHRAELRQRGFETFYNLGG
jgi:hypothetical protein